MASKRANISKPSETLTPTDRVVRLSAGDRDLARKLFSLMASVFEENCERLNDEYVEGLLACEEFWAIAAFSGDEIVGGMTAHTLPMTRTASSEVFIYDLAVRGDHRRRGVGRRLVTQLRKEAAAVGICEVFVAADNDDVHALDFYRAMGGVASPVRSLPSPGQTREPRPRASQTIGASARILERTAHGNQLCRGEGLRKQLAVRQQVRRGVVAFCSCPSAPPAVTAFSCYSSDVVIEQLGASRWAMVTVVGMVACTSGADAVGPTGEAGSGVSGEGGGQPAGGASATGAGGANVAGASGVAGSSFKDAATDVADGRTPGRDGAMNDGRAETPASGVAHFQNGAFSNDTSGMRINAHGPGFVQIGPTFYWVGEEMSDSSGISQRVNLYASTDLTNWELKHTLITAQTTPGLGITGRIVERPKLVYNDATHQFVMWVHWDSADYLEAAAGVFTSATIDGDYRFVRSFRPNANMSRDCTLFKDDDGTAYFISTANNNADLVVYQLTADYLDIQRQVIVLWPGSTREAPAMFKVNGRYFLINSGATSWNPNQAKYGWAPSVMGPWSALQNLGDGTAYGSQVSYVIPVRGTLSTTNVYFADRWQYPDLVSSKYIWLPLILNGTDLQLDYRDQWQLDLATGVVTP